MTQELATFDDRLKMRYVRTYPLPIERVWEAVTTSEHLDVWLLPASKVEARLGGACSFSWGSPADQAESGTVTEYVPPRRVQYNLDNQTYLRFELEPIDEGTRLFFIHGFAEGAGLEPSKDLGGDQPAGPDTPWKPGFVAGFHLLLDQLGAYLSNEWTRERAQPAIEAVYSGRNIQDAWRENPESRGGSNDPDSWQKLMQIYRDHIKATIPSAE